MEDSNAGKKKSTHYQVGESDRDSTEQGSKDHNEAEKSNQNIDSKNKSPIITLTDTTKEASKPSAPDQSEGDLARSNIGDSIHQDDDVSQTNIADNQNKTTPTDHQSSEPNLKTPESGSNKQRSNSASNKNQNQQRNENQEVSVIRYDANELISLEALETLSLIKSSISISQDANLYYDSFVTSKGKKTLPTADLKHFKDADSVVWFMKLYEHLAYKWGIWKELYYRVNKSLVFSFKKFKHARLPTLKSIDRAVWNSEKLWGEPMWSLAPLSRPTISHILYGVSHGAQETLLFNESYYDTLLFSYSFSSEIGSVNKVELELRPAQGDMYSDTFNLSDKIFDPAIVNFQNNIIDNKSMYSSGSFRKVLHRLIEFSGGLIETQFGQRSVSERMGLYTKSKSEKAYEDAFVIRVQVNDGVSITIEDKTLFDLFFSLLFLRDLDLTPEKVVGDNLTQNKIKESNGVRRMDVSLLLNYIITLLHAYIKTRLVVKSGVSIQKLLMKIELKRKMNDSAKLHNSLKGMVGEGLIVPISSYQWMCVVMPQKLEDDEWLYTKFISNIATTQANHCLHVYMPSLQIDSKLFIRQISRNRKMLQTNYYISDVSPPILSNVHDQISYDDFIDEMMIRSMWEGCYPQFFPIFSRGEWSGSNITSYNIHPPVHHRLAKFMVDDPENLYEIMTDDFAMYTDKPPFFMRRTTRITDKIPDIFNRIIY